MRGKKKKTQQTATRKPAANFYICDRWGHLAPWLRLCPLCCAAELSWLCPLVVVCITLLPTCRGFPNHVPFVLMGWAPCWGYVSSSFCSMHYPSSCFHPAGSSISGLGEVGSAGALGRALLLQSWLRALPLRVLRIFAWCTHCCLRGVCSLLLMQVHCCWGCSTVPAWTCVYRACRGDALPHFIWGKSWNQHRALQSTPPCRLAWSRVASAFFSSD